MRRIAGVEDAEEEPGQIGQDREACEIGGADEGREQRDVAADDDPARGEAGEGSGDHQVPVRADGDEPGPRDCDDQVQHEEAGEELAPAVEPAERNDVPDQLWRERRLLDQRHEGELGNPGGEAEQQHRLQPGPPALGAAARQAETPAEGEELDAVGRDHAPHQHCLEQIEVGGPGGRADPGLGDGLRHTTCPKAWRSAFWRAMSSASVGTALLGCQMMSRSLLPSSFRRRFSS